MVSDRLTDLALTVAPEGASPSVVKTAVNGGIVLLVLSFAKGILSVRAGGVYTLRPASSSLDRSRCCSWNLCYGLYSG